VLCYSSFFLFNDTATTDIYTLSLHDALPISARAGGNETPGPPASYSRRARGRQTPAAPPWTWQSQARRSTRRVRRLRSQTCALRSEEHTSELQSLAYLVCRLLLEKKNNTKHL